MKVLAIASTTLFPTDSRPTAGIFFANFLKCLQDSVEKVLVVSPTAWIPAPLLRLGAFAYARRIAAHQFWNGVEVYRPRYLGFRARRRIAQAARNFALAARPLCEDLHRRHRFDVVLTAGLGLTGHAAVCVGRDLRLPCVAWAIGSDVHTMPFRSRGNLVFLRRLVSGADLVLTVCDALRRQIRRLCPDAEHVQTFYRGIDMSPLAMSADRAAARRRLGWDEARTYMLSAGRCSKEKGVREFYDAFASLAPRRAELAAVWIGGGPERAGLQRRAEADGLAGRFTVTGNVPRQAVLEMMAAGDVMAFPSHAEGMPNVVVEAMAAGLPTVSTDVGGVREVIGDGRTGLVVPPGDAAALARAVQRILADPPAARRMARAGKELVRKYFDVARNARHAAELLAQLAAGTQILLPLAPAPGLPPGAIPAEAL